MCSHFPAASRLYTESPAGTANLHRRYPYELAPPVPQCSKLPPSSLTARSLPAAALGLCGCCCGTAAAASLLLDLLEPPVTGLLPNEAACAAFLLLPGYIQAVLLALQYCAGVTANLKLRA